MKNETIDELDDILNSIEKSEENEIEVIKTKELSTDTDTDVIEFEDLANQVMKFTVDDRKKADSLYELFYTDIAMGRDKTKGSAEAITKAVELKIAAGRNVIDIMRLLKEDKKEGTNVGIFLNSKKSGINLENVINDIKD